MKISLAELEYRIEKDQIDIINLSQKIQSLRMANEKDSFVDDVGKEECLYKYITKYEITFLVAADLESARYAKYFFLSCLCLHGLVFGSHINVRTYQFCTEKRRTSPDWIPMPNHKSELR